MVFPRLQVALLHRWLRSLQPLTLMTSVVS